MAETTILVRLEGHAEPLPLSDLTWERIAPCGCTCGVADAEHFGVDETTVAKKLTPVAAARRREVEEGFVLRLAIRSEGIERLRKTPCEHTPTWGVEKAPIPDGHRWAHSSGQNGHLVPVPADADKYRFIKHTEPICGRKAEAFVYDWNDHPTCRKCEKRAREMAVAVAASRLLDGENQ